MQNDSLFIEQAEYIPHENFLAWSSDHPHEEIILKKLTQTGAKLLTGPRGCGKSTLMLKAYYKLKHKAAGGAFPIYVNFKASLKLEPIYRSKANGGYWFSQWMYLMIYEGIYNSLTDSDIDMTSLPLTQNIESIQKLVSLLELGEVEKAQSLNQELTVYDLDHEINNAASYAGKTRSVLLLDDAAHAFSPEQQRDFFEFFRKVKSRSISPKAAIYPGVTSFAPTFNIGHDAEEIDAWVDPEDENYFLFMKTMLSRRLPNQVYVQFQKDDALLKLICFSSFGIPRILLNIVRELYEEKEVDGGITFNTAFNRKNILLQVKNSYKSADSVYSSLEQKLPTYKNYIFEGHKIYSRIIDLIKKYNKDKPIRRKSITLAIKKEVTSDLKRILGFYQYAGLVSHKGQVSRGEKGVFDLYIINLAALISNNAILAAKALRIEDLATALESRNAHEFTRTQSSYLLPKQAIKLSMPPCQNCGSERTSEEARFCATCGAPLKAASIYEKLISEDISVLPLTETRVKAIKKHSSIENIRDILLDIGHKELRSVPQVGKYWASKIFYLAEEYIS